MASEKQPETLYDFIFIDQPRIRSLYTQLFTGFLAERETIASESNRRGRSLQAGGDPFGSIASVNEQEVSDSSASRIDPHDLVLKDVLSRLSELGMICHDPAGAAPGNFLLLKGRVGIVDFSLCQGLLSLLPDILGIAEEGPSPRNKQRARADRNERKLATLLQKISALVPWSVTVLLQNDDVTAWGAISKEALRADPGHIMLKSGPVLAGQWYMLAIVDVAPNDEAGTITGLSEFAQGLLDGLASIRVAVGKPDHCIGVTPLLVFRELLPPGRSP